MARARNRCPRPGDRQRPLHSGGKAGRSLSGAARFLRGGEHCFARSLSEIISATSLRGTKRRTLSPSGFVRAPLGRSIGGDEFEAGFVTFRTYLVERPAIDEVIKIFGDIGRVVADALDILRHEK